MSLGPVFASRSSNLYSRGEGLTPGYKVMNHAAVRMHKRDSFGSTYASALMIMNPMMNNRRNQLIDWLSMQRKVDGRFTRRNGSSPKFCWQASPSSTGETGQSSIYAHTNKYQYARQSLTRTLPQGERAYQRVVCCILLKRNINTKIRGI